MKLIESYKKSLKHLIIFLYNTFPIVFLKSYIRNKGIIYIIDK